MQENNLQKEWNGKRNFQRNNSNMRNDTRLEVSKKQHGRDSYNKDKIDEFEKRPKIPNADAIDRSKYNNMIVSNLLFTTPSGKQCEVKGNQLLYYTSMPRKPLVDCKYIKMLKTIESVNDILNKKDVYYIRGCMYRKKEGETPEPCNISNQRISDNKCVGHKFQSSSIEFWIITNGLIEVDDDKEKEFKMLFLNKNSIKFIKEEYKENTDKLKGKSLFNLYNSMKDGQVKIQTVPKPGNTMFHTLFSDEVNVEIETIYGEILNGTVHGYELTPGGHPSINMWVKKDDIDTLRVIPLYTIGIINVINYKVSDLLSLRAIEMTIKGHIVIPHRGNNCIYDFCKRDKTDKDQSIKLDGTITPFNDLDNHDLELRNIVRNINYKE